MNKFFSNSIEKIKNWPVSQKVYASLWVITAIFLIVVIILLVVWQTSSLDLVKNTSEKLLTPDALYQQDVIAGLTFTTVALLAIAIFTTTISCYNKKKKGSKNANSKI